MSTTDCETVPIADDELPSYAVVELIADQRDVSVTEVGPVFYESGVDPDFLDALLAGSDGDISIRMSVDGFSFEVSATELRLV